MKLNNNSTQTLNTILFKYKEYLLVGLIIFLAFIIRMGILMHTVDFHGISNGRILEAQMILNGPLNLKFLAPVHPPVHMLFLIIGIKLFGFFPDISRIISLSFGLMTILFAYLYLKQIFNQQIALFSILGISLYSSHIIYSTIGTSETSFHFFLFLGLYILELFRRQRKRYLLFLFGLSVGIAAMCRYEGLLLIPFYMFFLREDKMELIEYTICALFVPVIWMGFNYFAFGNPLAFIQSNNFIVPFQFDWIRMHGININFIYKLFFWPKSLIQTLGLSVFSFGMGGICFCALKWKKKLFCFMFIMFFSIFEFRTIQETLYLQPRYGITLGLILIPFSIYFFFKVLEFFKNKIPNWIVLIMLWTMIIPIGEQVLGSPLYVPFFAKNTAAYLKNSSKLMGSIIFDDCGDEKYREPIKVLSGINPSRFILMPKILNEKGAFVVDEKEFFNILSSNNATTLVYSPKGGLKDILNLNIKNSSQQRHGFLFVLKSNSDPYYIYRVRKVEKNE